MGRARGGVGPPLVVVPGIQGRWEYLQPAIDVLRESFEVVSFPLRGERGSGLRFNPGDGFEAFAEQLDGVLEAEGLDRIVLCGVSFGGLVALRFAATRAHRVAALILVSPPGPGWQLGKRHELYTRSPWLLGPAFLAEFPVRVTGELREAIPSWSARLRFSWRQLGTALRAPLSFRRMAERARLIPEARGSDEGRQVIAPTLIVTGEPRLDRIVPVEGSERYAQLIPQARLVRLPRTGHLGYITRPQLFADTVRKFLEDAGVRNDPGRARTRHDAA